MESRDLISGPYAHVIADLTRRRDEIDKIIFALKALASSASSTQAQIPTSATEDLRRLEPHVPSPRLGGQIKLADAIKRVLSDAGRPLSTIEITDAIQAMGIALTGETPRNTVSSTLSRTARANEGIVKVGKASWAIPKGPEPEVEATADV